MDSSEERPFTLVEFLLRGRQQRSIEVVPWKWVSWDENRRKCVTKYSNPPYTTETSAEIQRLIENLCEAPQDWPTFNVRLKGSACTYSEALVKLSTLEIYEHAFTSDDTGTVKEKKLQNALRQKKLKTDEAKLREILADAARKSPADSFSGSSSSKKPRVLTTNKAKLRQTLDYASNLEPLAEPSVDTTPKRKCNFTKKMLSTTCTSLQNTPTRSIVQTSSVASTSSAQDERREFLKHKQTSMKRTTATKGSSSSGKSEELDCNQSSSIPTSESNSSNAVGNKSGKCVKEFAASAKDDVHQKLVQRLKLLQSGRPTTEDATVLDLCRATLIMLDGVRQDVETIKRNQKSAWGAASHTYDVAKHIGFCDEFQVRLPFQSIEEFFNFDERLRLDESLHKSFLQYLSLQIIVDQGLSKNITSVLKVMFTREVAMRFTAVKKTKDKKIIRETTFAWCFYDMIRQRRSEHKINTSEKEFFSVLGIQLTNSKDWDGHRSQRQVVGKKAPITDPRHAQQYDEEDDRDDEDDGNDEDDEDDEGDGDDEDDGDYENHQKHSDYDNDHDEDLGQFDGPSDIDNQQLDLFELIAPPF